MSESAVRCELRGLDPDAAFRLLLSVVQHCYVLADAPVPELEVVEPACADVIEAVAGSGAAVAAIECRPDHRRFTVRIEYTGGAPTSVRAAMARGSVARAVFGRISCRTGTIDIAGTVG